MNPVCGLLRGPSLSASSFLLVFESDQELVNMTSLSCGEVRLCIFFFTSGEVNKGKAPRQLPVFLLLGKVLTQICLQSVFPVCGQGRRDGTECSKASHGESVTNEAMNSCVSVALRKSPTRCCGSERPSGWRCWTAGTSSC